MGFNIDKIGKVIGSGALITLGPQLCAGMLNEWVKTLTVKDVAEWVYSDKRIWDNIPQEFQDKLLIWGPKFGDMKWLTPEYLVKECKAGNPAVCSLFINSPQAGKWLVINLEDLKKEVLPGYKVKVSV
jgi:hypothetical protein